MTERLVRVGPVVKGGLGLARTIEGTLLVEGALPGELVAVAPSWRQGGVERARVTRVVEPSAGRRDPPCPLYGACGGCDLQHAELEEQLRVKKGILLDCLARLGRVEAIPDVRVVASPEWGYRRRVRLHVVEMAGQRRIGFHRHHSRDVEDVPRCGLLTPGLAALLDRLRGDTGILEGVTGVAALEGDGGELSMLLEGGAEIREGRARIRASLEPTGAREVVVAVDGAAAVPTEDGVAVTTNGVRLTASARAFFQSNAALLHALVDEVARGLPDRCPLLWDLFAGVGLFGAALRARARAVVAVESDPQAFPLLRRNIGRGARIFTGTESEFLRRREPAPAVCVVDPPRPGLTRQSRELLARSGAAHIVYVGCDAASFAADVGALVRSGYGIRSLSLLDLFPQSAHVEAVAHLEH